MQSYLQDLVIAMLQCEELTRDVLCMELVALDNCIKSNPSATSKDMQVHIDNMASILMSDKDFKQVKG